jgi:hypothetical protein
MRAFVVRGPGVRKERRGSKWFQFEAGVLAPSCARPASALEHTSSDGSRGGRTARRAAVLSLRAAAPGLIPTVALGRYRRFRAEAIAAFVERVERDPDRVRR